MQTAQEKVLGALLLTAIPIAKEKLVVTTVTSLASIPTDVRYALIEVEGATSADYVRYWQSGEDPTSTDGIKRGDGTAFDLIGPVAIRQFRVIGVGAGATLQIQYFK